MGGALLTGSAPAAFLAGMVAFFAPCCAFVMLPTYLASVAGASRWRTAALTGVFVLEYGMLGHGGMQHPTQDGHAFTLLGADGKVLWHHAYQDMYVSPGQLMADMNARVKDSGSTQMEMGS